jgi:hypothetical protein
MTNDTDAKLNLRSETALSTYFSVLSAPEREVGKVFFEFSLQEGEDVTVVRPIPVVTRSG